MLQSTKKMVKKKMTAKTIVSPYGNTDFEKLAADVADDTIFWTSNKHSRIFFVDQMRNISGTKKASELLMRTSTNVSFLKLFVIHI